MGKIVNKLLRYGLLAFSIFCMIVVLYRVVEGAGGQNAYDNAAEIAFRSEPAFEKPAELVPAVTSAPTEPKKTFVWRPVQVEDDEHMARLREMDLDALKEVNPDVLGWIFVPDTKIDYPILQGEDNQFYLYHTWEKVSNGMGSIFLETRNLPDFTDFNTIVYGHNMNNGYMFADLKKFASAHFLEKNPYVYIRNEAGVFRYEVFSYYKTPVDGFVYSLSFNQRETRQKFIDSALEESYYDIGVVPVVTDRILTLSTCSGGSHETRWVVLARMEMERIEQ